MISINADKFDCDFSYESVSFSILLCSDTIFSAVAKTKINSFKMNFNTFYQLIFWCFDFIAVTMEANSPLGTNIWPNHCNGSTSQSPSLLNDIEQFTRKKTWSELKESVTELRKQLSRLSTMVPTNIQFRTLSDSRIRIYFLGTPPNGWETTLLCTDITPAMLANTNDDHSQQNRTRLVNSVQYTQIKHKKIVRRTM